MLDEQGYILRISTDEWLSQVYDLKKYYSGVIRNWKKDTKILLVKKEDEGDSFIGYGVVGKAEKLVEMSLKERKYCRENNWRRAIIFKTLYRFNKPLPIKKSPLRDDPRKGSFLHGVKLSKGTVDKILESANEYQS